MGALRNAWPGAVAVSGGRDSLALMLLLADWTNASGREKPVVLTVDHGLHVRSAVDAKNVVKWAKHAGLSAHILRWQGAKPSADIEAQARNARYRLMGQWCAAHDVGHLYVAHTLEDQAETFLLRLGRGSGVDGLASMHPQAPYPVPGLEGIALMRPLLGISRHDLRAWLTAHSHVWIEDPMNDEARYFRTRVRALLPALAKAGIPAYRIAAAAAHLARARQALERDTSAFLETHCRFTETGALFDSAAICALPREIALRALSRMLTKVSGETYGPRFERLERLLNAIAAGIKRGATLHGCRIGPAPRIFAAFGTGSLAIVRETGRKSTAKRQVNPAGLNRVS